jgi:hypothetical protein
MQFLIWKRGIFCKFKEIKGLSEGEHLFAAPANLQIDAEIVKKSRFRTETIYVIFPQRCLRPEKTSAPEPRNQREFSATPARNYREI